MTVFPQGSGITKLVRQTPADGCLLVFNVNNLNSWRTTCYRLGMSCLTQVVGYQRFDIRIFPMEAGNVESNSMGPNGF